MELKSIVVVSLHDPKEKIWGQLIAMTPAGVTVRGIDVNSFDDFIAQVKNPEEGNVGLATIFYPMHRVERVALDEAKGSIPSLAQMFEHHVGRSLLEYLEYVASLSEPD
ncbi:MAG TPA: hypothetical protein VNN18_10300 [Candidatus Xenobia bacterium]|nr:hypothetical protein [Candidatus Xenobia bacterium]